MFQRITLIGNVGRDPEMRYTADGTPVTSFSVATNVRVSKSRQPECPNGWKESFNGQNWELTTWWKVSCWRQLAEVTNQYLSKGRQVFVEGEMRGDAVDGTLNPRVWTGNDGVARASFEITARNVKFLGGAAEHQDSEPGVAPSPTFAEDDIPF